MNALPASTHADVPAPKTLTPITLSMRGLLGIYAIIPLCLILYALDRLVLHGSLLARMPSNPDKLFLFGLLFGWPHILASTTILVTNREYLRAYGLRTLLACVVIILFFGVGNFVIPYIVLSVVAATVTTIHVFKQQVGIGQGASRLSHWSYTVWAWTSILTGVFMYNSIYLEADIARYKHHLDVISAVLGVLVFLLTCVCHVQIQRPLGKAFLWGNAAMVLVPLLMHFRQYDIFAMAIPRVIHDVTAFAFYIAHDRNKHDTRSSNALYRVIAKIPGGLYWIAPAFAVGLAWFLEHKGDHVFLLLTSKATAERFPNAVSLGVLGFFSMVHYFTEAFTWKNGSPYRRHIRMV